MAPHIHVYGITILINHFLIISNEEINFKTVFYRKIIVPFNKDKRKFYDNEIVVSIFIS